MAANLLYLVGMSDCNRKLMTVAIDPATGCELREATAAEVGAYLAQPTPHGLVAFRKSIRVGNVLVDQRFADCFCNACVRTAQITAEINWAFE